MKDDGSTPKLYIFVRPVNNEVEIFKLHKMRNKVRQDQTTYLIALYRQAVISQVYTDSTVLTIYSV